MNAFETGIRPSAKGFAELSRQQMADHHAKLKNTWDSSIKWIGADRLLCRLPVATVSALIFGPGTTITHTAIKACADSNTPLFWMGEEGLRFYAYGLQPNHANSMARVHATAWGQSKMRNEIARRMFRKRFTDADIEHQTIKRLRGMEGKRVRSIYGELGTRYGVAWRGRDYNPANWNLADGINRALSAANASLYALTAAVVCSMGFIPQLGFVHEALPFIYDVADLYKHEISWPAAFEAISIAPRDDGSLTRKILKRNVETTRLFQRMPEDRLASFSALFANGFPHPRGDGPPKK